MEEVEKEDFDILENCKTAMSYSDVIDKYGGIQIDELISKHFWVKDTEKWRISNVLNVEIETTTICNNKCIYCPVRYEPKPKRVMDMERFKHIINKICQYGRKAAKNENTKRI